MRSTLLAAATAALAATAAASPIVYTVSGIGSGSLNGTAFSDKAFTLTGTSDTTLVTNNGFYGVALLSSSVSVDGLTSDVLASDMRVFSSAGRAGFYTGNEFGGFIVAGVADSALDSYDLTTAIGPVSSTPQAFGITGGTSLGSFRLDSASSESFTAQAVPEPASMAALGLGALGVLKRRKRA